MTEITREQELQLEYIELKELTDETKALLEAKRQEIIEASGGNAFQGQYLSMSVNQRRGNIDYPSLFRFHNISDQEQDAYRRESTTSFTLRINPAGQQIEGE